MLLKLGSTGRDVISLQKFLNITADGDFGRKTEEAVKVWQANKGLKPTGVVDASLWKRMTIPTTDLSESSPRPIPKDLTKTPFTTKEGLIINQFFLPTKEYFKGPIKPEWLFIHHTAGWHNPYNTVRDWAGDTRGRVATEFVIGGPSITGKDFTFDGEIVQAFPHLGYGWHLGDNGSQNMHKNSIGIEVCNFGYIQNGLTYAGTRADQSQTVTLHKEFRGYRTWHRYSDKQLESLRDLILYIGNRDNINIRAGLPALISRIGADAFEFNIDAYNGKIKGLWSHTNTRRDKVDMFPQPELMDMLTSL